MEAHDPYAALRFRDYRHVLVGNVLANTGTEMQSMVVGWELYQRTKAASALGLVGLALFVPVFLLSLPAGHVADRFSRKGMLLAAQGLMAVASLGLAGLSFGQGPIPLVYLCLVLAGISRAFSMPARWALVPQVVSDRALPNAVTWNSSGWQIASMTGPTLGGLLIAATGQAGWAYVLGALTCLACAGLLIPVRPRVGQRPRQAPTLHSVLAGIRFIVRTKLILATITLDLFAVLLGGATALLPIFAEDILHVGATGLGWLRAAPSVGALLMALSVAHLPPFRHAGRALLGAVAGFGLATIAFGFAYNFAFPYAFSLVMLALTGALDNISVIVRGTLVQVLTPDAMRGRVSAVNAIFISSSNELGAFESGITAQYFGPIASVVGGGIGTVLVVLAVMLLWPEILRLGPLHRVEKAPLPEAESLLACEEEPAPRR